MKKVKPYEISSIIYDQLMDHVNYKDWAAYIHEIFEKFHIPGHTVVEAGCGTGTLMAALHKLDYRISGFDISFEMVRQAKQKYTLPVWQADLRSFKIQKTDVILCLYDCVQYLSLDEFPELLSHIFEQLNKGGLFIFDIVTEMHILTYWKHAVDRDEADRYRFTRKSWFDPRNKIQHTEIECYDFISKNAYIEHHRQHVFNLDDLIQTIFDSELSLQRMLADFTFNEGNAKSDRIHFVLKKEKS